MHQRARGEPETITRTLQEHSGTIPATYDDINAKMKVHTPEEARKRAEEVGADW